MAYKNVGVTLAMKALDEENPAHSLSVSQYHEHQAENAARHEQNDLSMMHRASARVHLLVHTHAQEMWANGYFAKFARMALMCSIETVRRRPGEVKRWADRFHAKFVKVAGS